MSLEYGPEDFEQRKTIDSFWAKYVLLHHRQNFAQKLSIVFLSEIYV
jgi:hypothetical protein